MLRFQWSTPITGLLLLLAGCGLPGMGGTPVQNASLRTPTSLPMMAATQPAMPSPTPPQLTLTPTLIPADTKPGPPPGYVEPTFVPTLTITLPSATEWKEIVLPPPQESEQIVPTDVVLPTVSLSIPSQWTYTRRPGSYLLHPGPEPAPPILVLGLSLPFADWREPIPHDMEGFTQALVRVSQRAYGIADVRAERILVGGQEAVAIFFPEGEACMAIFVPVAGRYDVTYKFTFMRPLCGTNQDVLSETARFILQSVRFNY